MRTPSGSPMSEQLLLSCDLRQRVCVSDRQRTSDIRAIRYLLSASPMKTVIFLVAASPATTPATADSTGLHPQVLAAFAGAIVAVLFALAIGFVSHRRETQARNDQWTRDK